MSSFFINALDLREHPLKKSKIKMRCEYYAVLECIIEGSKLSPEDMRFAQARLQVYHKMLLPEDLPVNAADLNFVREFCDKPWRRKFRFLLAADIALIIPDDEKSANAYTLLTCTLTPACQSEVKRFVTYMRCGGKPQKGYLTAEPLVRQYRANREFLSKPERRIIVTANMSAGKSTLINALIGKPIARTSMEACTGNVNRIYSKPYEDGRVHFMSDEINLSEEINMDADTDTIRGVELTGHTAFASYFAGTAAQAPRICLIDTPGVDAALYKEHTTITHNALLSEQYDTVLYVISPTNLGTDAEMNHLRWVAKNVAKDKVIFVLNKLDKFHEGADSVDESIASLREDLVGVGFENPVICPISAYYSYLAKLKMTGQTISEMETYEFDYLSIKFMRPAYDLSRFYGGQSAAETEEQMLCKRAGVYGLENIIYGG